MDVVLISVTLPELPDAASPFVARRLVRELMELAGRKGIKSPLLMVDGPKWFIDTVRVETRLSVFSCPEHGEVETFGEGENFVAVFSPDTQHRAVPQGVGPWVVYTSKLNGFSFNRRFMDEPDKRVTHLSLEGSWWPEMNVFTAMESSSRPYLHVGCVVQIGCDGMVDGFPICYSDNWGEWRRDYNR